MFFVIVAAENISSDAFATLQGEEEEENGVGEEEEGEEEDDDAEMFNNFLLPPTPSPPPFCVRREKLLSIELQFIMCSVFRL